MNRYRECPKAGSLGRAEGGGAWVGRVMQVSSSHLMLHAWLQGRSAPQARISNGFES